MKKKFPILLPLILLTPFVMTSVTSCETAQTNKIKSIEIEAEPSKVNYYVGDSVNFEGIELVAVYQSGSRKPVSIEDCSIIGASTISSGDHKVIIEYKGKSTSFIIYVNERVAPKTLKNMDVDALPTKVNYLPGEEFDKTGMVVNAKYSDGSIDNVTNSVIIEITEPNGDAADMNKVGVKTVKVKFGGKFDTFTIYVRETEGLDDSNFGDNTEGHAFSNMIDNVLENHNYSIGLTSYIEYHQEDLQTSTYFNLNNKAYYNYDSDSGIYGGLLLQKDQGFVTFRQSATSGNISLGNFYSTSLVHMASDIYDVVIENVLNAKWEQDSENHSKFLTSDYYSIATGCNFTGYAASSNLEAPEYIIAEYIDDTHFNLTIDFTVIYWDTDIGEMVREPGHCYLDVAIGTASNAILESYINNPTYIYVAPTSWSKTDQSYFKKYFGIVPPFVDGVSYSFEFDVDSDYRGNYLYIVDYACGDIREAYRTKLLEANYLQVGNDSDHYRYVVEKGLRIFNYDVYLKYNLPTMSYNGKTYGYYYPQGMMYLEFIKSETTSVNTVARYNKFVQEFVGKNVLPEVPFGDEVTSVTNFVYSSNTEVYKFYQSDYTRFHIASYSKAVEDMNAFLTALSQYGYTEIVYNKEAKIYNCFREGKSSYISISALDQIEEESYSGILDIRCQLYAQEY